MLVNWITPSDTSLLYFHHELPWVPDANGVAKGGFNTENVFNWLLSCAQTPEEKQMVEQEEAYDQSTPGMPPQFFGNGVDMNSLFGWGAMGVDPFQPFGPDQGLGQTIKNLVDGNTANLSPAQKEARERARKVKEETSVQVQGLPTGAVSPAQGGQAGKELSQIDQELQISAFVSRISLYRKTSDPN